MIGSVLIAVAMVKATDFARRNGRFPLHSPSPPPKMQDVQKPLLCHHFDFSPQYYSVEMVRDTNIGAGVALLVGGIKVTVGCVWEVRQSRQRDVNWLYEREGEFSGPCIKNSSGFRLCLMPKISSGFLPPGIIFILTWHVVIHYVQ